MSDKEIDISKELRIYIATHFDGINKNYAEHIDVSSSFLSAVIRKKKKPTTRMLQDLGLSMKKVSKVEYSRVNDASTTREQRVNGA